MYMRSSTVLATMNFVTWTMLSCPIRCIRSTACSSLPLFHHGSTMMPRHAMVRLSPWQQHFVLMRKTLIRGSRLNCATLCPRVSKLSDPSMVRWGILSSLKASVSLSMLKKRGNMQKTRILLLGSSFSMLWISSATAIALVDALRKRGSASSFWASSFSIILASTSSRLFKSSSFPSFPPSPSSPPCSSASACDCDCDSTSPTTADALRAIIPLHFSFFTSCFSPSFSSSLPAPPSTFAASLSLSELPPSISPPSCSLSCWTRDLSIFAGSSPG
mmetsp:Transcript_24384/g.58441  ORF Transcript_24384/g.58441 Transcript_24384/m.58441 type:complete len:274 (+) Transcript_24384:387-1208(+)